MNEGIRTIIYPVGDVARARTLYSELLGVEPYMEQERRPAAAGGQGRGGQGCSILILQVPGTERLVCES